MSARTEKKKKTANKTQLLLLQTTIVYLLMGFSSLLACQLVHGNYAEITSFIETTMPLKSVAALIVSATLIIIMLSYLLESSSLSFRESLSYSQKYLGQLPFAAIIYLAALGSVAEELLFRGAVQPSLGIIATSIIVALLHIDPRLKLSSWTLLGFVKSILLGVLFYYSKSLIPCVVTHFLVNVNHLFRYHRLTKKKSNC